MGLFWISFGPKITLIYAVFVITLAVLSGYLLQKLKFDRYIRQDLLAPSCSDKATNSDCSAENSKVNPHKTVQLNRITFIKETFSQFVSFMPYMILGVAIGAVLHGYVPTSFFGKLSSIASYWLIPITAIIGVFLYVRASTMVPIAAALAAKGMSMGAIMSLTIGGAGASLPEMIMMKKMFHWPLLLAFIGLVFTTAA